MYKKLYDDYVKNSTELYETIDDKKIISIDIPGTLCLDNAFSIEKDGNGYILDVYVTDVVTFLNYNRPLAEEAYKKASSHYYETSKGVVRVSMLPDELSNNLLSLNHNGYKNVIHFVFNIDSFGIIQNHNIKLSRIRKKFPLTYKGAESVLKDNTLYPAYDSLINLREIAPVVLDNFGYNNAVTDIDAMSALPSLMVNRLIAYDADTAIYKNSKSGTYTKRRSLTSASATPLRNFSSDINLALYLYQYKLGNISDRDVYMIKDNFPKIIKHFNDIEYIDRYVKKLVKNHIIL